jgi:hypothetical protein
LAAAPLRRPTRFAVVEGNAVAALLRSYRGRVMISARAR